MASEFMYKLIGKPYIEVCILLDGRVSSKFYRENDGKKFVYFKELDLAFVVPSMKDDLEIEKKLSKENIEIQKSLYKSAIKDGLKTTIYYNPDMATALSITDMKIIAEQDLNLIYTMNHENKLTKFIYRISKSTDEYINTKNLKTGITKICNPLSFVPVAIDAKSLGRMINTKHHDDIMSVPSNIFEHLAKPILVGVIMAGIIGILAFL